MKLLVCSTVFSIEPSGYRLLISSTIMKAHGISNAAKIKCACKLAAIEKSRQKESMRACARVTTD